MPIPSEQESQAITINRGLYKMGYSGEQFCYDIELPEHSVYLNDYKIDAYPITNKQYIKFVEDGGYDDFKYWLSDGWDKIQGEKWKAPMYWEKIDGEWMTCDFLGKREINPNEPVCHVSYYEAMAFCKWKGGSLPKESQWEYLSTFFEESSLEPLVILVILVNVLFLSPGLILSGLYPQKKSLL